MEKEVMDALCMLHSLAKKDTTYTTQDEQFNIIKKYIEKQQKEIKHELNQRKYWRDNFYKQQKEIEELKKPKYLVHFENNKITKMELINDFISKDKIREKIKELRKTQDFKVGLENYAIKILQELLKEN